MDLFGKTPPTWIARQDQPTEGSGLKFRLSDGDGEGSIRAERPKVEEQTLSDAETRELLGRTAPLSEVQGDASGFKLRPDSRPAPKTGESGEFVFPKIGEGLPQPRTGTDPLTVVRFSPEGDVGLTSELFITFSEPMVSIGSQQDAASYVPAKITPFVPGRWRWLGTKTLTFNPERRFPLATEFSVEIPGGIESASGKALAKPTSWKFRTSAPSAVSFSPSGNNVSRSPLMVAQFDQEIDQETAIKLVRATVAGKRLAVRVATTKEVKADESLSNRISNLGPRRFLVFRIAEDESGNGKFAKGSKVDVVIGKGVRSLEGERRSEKDFSYSFQTHGPLSVTSSQCGWGGECRPTSVISISFSNRLDPSSISEEMIKADPPIEGMKITPSYLGLSISGIKKPRRNLRINISGNLRDEFGQTLGKDVFLDFKIGGLESEIFPSGDNLITLDPFLKNPRYSFHSINVDAVKVRMRTVRAEDWKSYREFLGGRYGVNRKKGELPGTLVFDRVVNLKKSPDEIVRTDLDLSPGLKVGLGHLILEIEQVGNSNSTAFISWVQVTKLGLDAFVDGQDLVAFVSELKTGKPVPGASVTIQSEGKHIAAAEKTVTDSFIGGIWNWIVGFGSSLDAVFTEEKSGNVTDASGVVKIGLPENPIGENGVLLAQLGNDFAFVPSQTQFFWGDRNSWSRKSEPDEVKWFVFDDRNIYRPGEEVSFKGYVRSVGMGKGGDVLPVGSLGSLEYSVSDSRGVQITKGATRFNSFGAFDLRLKLPENINLGRATLTLGRNPSETEHILGFEIQEFRRPEFEVETRVVSEAPHLVGDSARVMASAKYFAGGALGDSTVQWAVEAKPARYTPPNRDEYSFGTWVPWWREYSGDSSSSRQTFSGQTDAAGNDFLRLDFDSVSPARPYALTVSSAVSDVNRQVFASSSSMLVHPSSIYVGLKTARSFVEKGKPFKVEAIATDIDGRLVSGKQISISAVLKDWVFRAGKWEEENVDSQECVVVSAESAVSCDFIAKAGGRYKITAQVSDDRNRPNESELQIWVAGGKVVPSTKRVEEEEVELIPSKAEYAPGDLAEILVNSPFGPAEGILTVRRGGVVRTERFKIVDDSAVLRIPIEEAFLPNVIAHVRLVGTSRRVGEDETPDASSPIRPAFATGSVDLKVSTASRRLTVNAVPVNASLVPGAGAKVDITVRDSDGKPVEGSEVALIVVDESVLSLTRYSIQDPLAIFYPSRSQGTSDYDSRSTVLLMTDPEIDSQAFAMPASASERAFAMPASPLFRMMVGDSATGSEEAAIRTRTDFNPLAVFTPSVVTDRSGKATVEFVLPDNLTRYRITAVAADEARRFGKGESSLTARQPLMVRPAAPRFANFGDGFDLPVVIQNQTDSEMTVNVAMRASHLRILGGAGKRVSIPANDRAEISFPVETLSAGVSRIQFVATSDRYTDAAEIAIPIYTPATTEAFATYGSLDSQTPLLQSVAVPRDIFTEYGELEVSVSSTQLQELTDAFLYLYRYPFECTEQISSRMMSVAALKDVLKEFKSDEIPTQDEIAKSFERDIDSILKRQRSDGSFGLWTVNRERYEYPFVSVHAAHALAVAKFKGYKVPAASISKSLSYLRNIESRFDEMHQRSPVARLTVSGYALHVRAMLGDNDARKAKKILSENDIASIPFEALGWLLGVLSSDGNSGNEVESVKRFLMNRVTETASTASFVTGQSDGGFLVMHSSRRADGVLLDALLKVEPRNDLVPKLVKGLLAQRKKGAWASTQENVFILLAMDSYFKEYEGVTPDFIARMWYGTTYGGEVGFSGRSARTDYLRIPMQELIARGSATNLILQRDGKGRLYYRIGLKYAPISLRQDAADYGFEVTRLYEAVDDPGDVVRNGDGTWTIKAGSRVRVKLQMSNGSRRYHVALVDRLPAGFEVLNPGLAVTESLPSPSEGDSGNWWRRNWYEHRNLRDDRVEAFASILYGGVYEYSYVVRATTPGRFVSPAAKAEEMYSPETFGRSASDTVVVR
jgi:uncharacterized protein YfaS (alpha-2-macroglobulin family)